MRAPGRPEEWRRLFSEKAISTMLLAIDTSTRSASVALLDGRGIQGELTWQSEMNHTSELYPAVQSLLRLARLEVAGLTRLAVAIGPGSFNGLRVGVSMAKALSLSLGIPLVGVTTLDMQAYQHSWCGRPVCAILRAGREEVAVAVFERRAGVWTRLVEEQITTLTELAAKVVGETLVTGEIDERLAADIAAIVGPEALILPPEARLRRAGFLAALGWERHEAGLVADAATIQPLYLRRPPITARQKP